MSEQNNQNKVIQWAPEAKIEITGLEYDAFQKTMGFLEQFIPALQAKNDILKRMLDQGIAYEFDTTQELTEEQATELNGEFANGHA